MATTSLGLSEKQQAMRMEGVGASEVFDVLHGGIKTYCQKVGEAEPFQGNSLTEFGHRIEPVIAEAYVDRHPGIRVFTPGTLRHPEHRWAMATLDRVVAPPGIGRPARESWLEALEIKVAFFSGGDYGEGADEVPEHHLVQTQWQMGVSGLAKATLVALVNGDYREYPMPADPEMFGLLLEVVGKFWRDNVLARVPPPPNGSKAYTDYVRRKYGRDDGPVLPATPEAAAVVKRLREVKALAKAAQAEEDRVKQELLLLMGNSPAIEGLVTNRKCRDGTEVDLDAAAEGLIIRLCENPLSGGYSLPRVKVEELWQQVKRDFTTTKPGYRSIRLLGKG